MSQIRQNFHENAESAVNKAINTVLGVHYHYMEMAFHFDRDDVAHPKMHNYFLKLSERKQEQVDKLMKYQNMRGGRNVLQSIQKPPTSNTDLNIAGAFKNAIAAEQQLNIVFKSLHDVADKTNDPQFSDFIEDGLMTPEVELLKELANHLSLVQKAGPGLGEFIFDKEFDS